MSDRGVDLFFEAPSGEGLVHCADLSAAIARARRMIEGMSGIPLRVVSPEGEQLMGESEIMDRVIRSTRARWGLTSRR